MRPRRLSAAAGRRSRRQLGVPAGLIWVARVCRGSRNDSCNAAVDYASGELVMRARAYVRLIGTVSGGIRYIRRLPSLRRRRSGRAARCRRGYQGPGTPRFAHAATTIQCGFRTEIAKQSACRVLRLGCATASTRLLRAAVRRRLPVLAPRSCSHANRSLSTPPSFRTPDALLFCG